MVSLVVRCDVDEGQWGIGVCFPSWRCVFIPVVLSRTAALALPLPPRPLGFAAGAAKRDCANTGLLG